MDVKELDVVKLKDGRQVTLLDFVGDGTGCVFEDNKKHDVFFGSISEIEKIIWSNVTILTGTENDNQRFH